MAIKHEEEYRVIVYDGISVCQLIFKDWDSAKKEYIKQLNLMKEGKDIYDVRIETVDRVYREYE